MNIWELLDALLGGAAQGSTGRQSGPASYPANGPRTTDRPVDPQEWEAGFREQWDKAREDSEAVLEKTRSEMREQLETSRTEIQEALSASQGELTSLKRELTERLTTVEKALDTLAVQAEDTKRLERKVNLLLGMCAAVLLAVVILAYRVG